ncbi:hypothetical protein [Microbulbifer yueqingensis]|uniref:D-glycerate 3-kinase n=1 Tax=Microbulbifer yueqingensis TaxID=658219 RepID=A0A1G8XRT8_9GAMM|nr:hypothetical protein [Microbulbifer yueqingensis]SDJ93279.1 D-glycerate 3-kinase [Microbulbifer yueqingensis]
MAESAWPGPVRARADELQGELGREIDRFIAAHQLPDSFRQVIVGYYLPLAVWLAGQREEGRTLVVGICGGQGSGKSTLTDFLRMVWRALGLESAGFSLDDIYLTRNDRRQLARRVHPLLATRGVPGTHDVGLGIETLDALAGKSGARNVAIPVFDKSIDDRAPVDSWPVSRVPVDILLFEGWCVGARPWQADDDPVNDLERSEDADGSWRNYIREQLDGPYRSLFARLDLLVMLQVPGMESVLEWRRLQEHKLRERTGRGMTDAEIARFVQHYERVTRHLLAEMPDRADCVLKLDRHHRICALQLNPAPGGDS